MPNWLLLFAGVNLALSLAIAVSTGSRRLQTAQRYAVVGLPALWALFMLGAYGYFWASMPASQGAAGPTGRYLISHGNITLLLWEQRVNTASGLALWLTVAMLLMPLVFWLARSLSMRTWRSITS